MTIHIDNPDVSSAAMSKSFHIITPANATTYNVWRVPQGITLTAVNCFVKGGTSLTGALYTANKDGASAVTATVAASITVASGNTQSTIAYAAVVSTAYLLWITTATSGAVESFTCTFDYQ